VGFIVISIVLGIIFLVSVGFAFISTSGKVAAGATIAVFFLMFGIFSATTVPARSVGIQTGFGKYQKTLDNGFHWTNPTSSVEKFSTQVQTLKLDDGDKNAGKTAVPFTGGGKGSVDVTVNWQISDKKAKQLWERFKSFDNVRDDLVQARARDAIRKAVGAKTANEALAGEALDPMAATAKASLQAATSEFGVEIVGVTFTNVDVDDSTRASIQKVIAAQQDIERAKADNERAKIDAETAKLREQAGALSPAANQRYCLDVTNNWDVNKNGPLNIGWNCMGASNTTVAVK
jgi:regulator of protease activity HflC (stomatin/prohibitin superfamily)